MPITMPKNLLISGTSSSWQVYHPRSAFLSRFEILDAVWTTCP